MGIFWLVFGCQIPTRPAARAPQGFEPILSGPSDAPVVVVFHGLGDKPENMVEMIASCGLNLRIVAPHGEIPYHDGWSWFDVHALGEDMSYDEAAMISAVDRLSEQLPRWRTPGKPLTVTGFSQGGVLTYGIALRHPDQIDQAIPIAGTWPLSRLPPLPAIPPPPLRAMHGTADDVVPLAPTSALVAALAQGGWNVTLSVAQGVEHTVSAEQHAALCRQLAALR